MCFFIFPSRRRRRRCSSMVWVCGIVLGMNLLCSVFFSSFLVSFVHRVCIAIFDMNSSLWLFLQISDHSTCHTELKSHLNKILFQSDEIWNWVDFNVGVELPAVHIQESHASRLLSVYLFFILFRFLICSFISRWLISKLWMQLIQCLAAL